MVWRIHFTAEDLARTTVAETLGPLAETVLGLQLLRSPCRWDVSVDAWRRWTSGRLVKQMRPLVSLCSRGPEGIDLLTLTGEAPTIEEGIEALLGLRRERVLAELKFGSRHRPLPSTAWTLADRASTGRRLVADAAYTTYQTLVEPHWAKLHAHLNSERISHGQIMLVGGVERLLTSLQPERIRWRMPVLEVQTPFELDIHLAGRGLVVVPSVFVGSRPRLLWDLTDEGAPPRLIVPATSGPVTAGRLLVGGMSGDRALAALVGRTRAQALHRISSGSNTTELARHLGVSPAAASQHATVLRNAGLITTERQGGAVWHTLTPLGIALISGS